MTGNQHGTTAHTGAPRTNVKKPLFFAVAFVVFGASVMALSAFDLLPSGTLGEEAPRSLGDSQASTGQIILPEKIEIPALDLTATVANPTTADPDVLDANLTRGAVRYPTSGTLGANGTNVVIFGHSSYLPVVHNQAYKTFDGIQDLKKGQEILVTGGGRTYVYQVETVASASASRDAIPLSVSGNKLTLVTCDSFKTKSDRFVVIAHLVESYPNAS